MARTSQSHQSVEVRRRPAVSRGAERKGGSGERKREEVGKFELSKGHSISLHIDGALLSAQRKNQYITGEIDKVQVLVLRT